jgi:peptidoglycan/xylan/chitin deacetylase (PgdA/CDA1 family)
MRRLVALVLVCACLAPLMPGGSSLQRAAAAAGDVHTITHFDVSTPVVALTFDAGSDRGHAAYILDTLAAHGARATFGVTGRWAEQNPDMLQRIVAEGHTLLNHSWDHPAFVDISSEARQSQLRRTEDTVRRITGQELQPFFRPPYGEYNNAVLADLAANGYTWNILWSIDTLGWQGLSATAINERVLSRIQPGGIILMHLGSDSQDAAALPAMLDQLAARGYTFATIHDFVNGNLSLERYFPETGFWVRGNFLRFWNAFGGLPTFGYPITDAFEEGGMSVQYFERARMEWQPGIWPAHFDILLGLLGVELTHARRNEQQFLRRPGASTANCDYYPETGHSLCYGFRDWWRSHGGLTILGYPISDEFSENGRTVQYFERARFEWHPENAPPWNVLLAHYGRIAWETHRQ